MTLPNGLRSQRSLWHFDSHFIYLRILSMEDSHYEIRFYRLHATYCHIYAKYILSLIVLCIILKYNFIKFGPFQLCVNFMFYLQCEVESHRESHIFESSNHR